MFLCDLLLSSASNYFTNYANDSAPYVIGSDAEEVVPELKAIAQKLFICFAKNEMKAKLVKCHLRFSMTEAFNFEISETVIHNSHSRKLVEVKFDNKLKLEKHIITICQKANRKLNALPRVISYMDLRKRQKLMNVFFNS